MLERAGTGYAVAVDEPLESMPAAEVMDQYLLRLCLQYRGCPLMAKCHLGLVWTRGRSWWVSFGRFSR